MSKETSQWICDQCGKEIENVKDGWVEWLSYTNEDSIIKGKDIRIVHRIDCLYDESLASKSNNTVSDMDLESFSEADGLMDLLEFISDDKFDDKEEVLEIIKRIHIPGYERVRNNMHEAILDGIFEPNRKMGYYSQMDINRVIKSLV